MVTFLLAGCTNSQLVSAFGGYQFNEYGHITTARKVVLANACYESGEISQEKRNQLLNSVGNVLRVAAYDEKKLKQKIELISIDKASLLQYCYGFDEVLQGQYQWEQNVVGYTRDIRNKNLNSIAENLNSTGRSMNDTGKAMLNSSTNFQSPPVNPLPEKSRGYNTHVPNPANSIDTFQVLMSQTKAMDGSTVCVYSLGSTVNLTYGTTTCPRTIN